MLTCGQATMVADRIGTNCSSPPVAEKNQSDHSHRQTAPAGATNTPFPGGRAFNGQTVKRHATYKRALSFASRASEFWILKARLAVEAVSYHKGRQV